MALIAHNLSCGYGGTHVVRDVEFSLEAGHVVAVLGPNGVGKTTLFKTILGFLPALGGAVEVDGRDARGLSRPELAQAVAYVPQSESTPFAYTVEESVLMGRAPHLRLLEQPGPEDRAIARQALDEMGIGHLAAKACTEVSGGELQLVSIARALAQRPRYLVMDEPTASLDFGNQARVLRRVRDLAAAGMGVLMTTHDPDQAFELECDVVLLRRDGESACGPVREVLTEEALSATYGVRVLVGSFEREGVRVDCCKALAGD